MRKNGLKGVDWVTVEELARKAGKGVQQIQRWARKGLIDGCQKHGHSYYIPSKTAERIIATGKPPCVADGVSVRELGKIFKVSIKFIYNSRRDGRIPKGRRVLRCIIYTQEEVEWIRKNGVPLSQPPLPKGRGL